MIGYLKRIYNHRIGAVALGVLVAYIGMMLSRIVFLMLNWATFASSMTAENVITMLRGALVFDTATVMYVNVLWVALMLIPLHWKETPRFYSAMKWLWMITNGVAIASNLADSVYFQYTGRRSTVTVFSEFAGEDGIVNIILGEMVHHWYLFVYGAIIYAVMWVMYRSPKPKNPSGSAALIRYYASGMVMLIVAAPLAIIGMRGSATAGTRPITVNNANEYVSRASETALVLNTPFSIIRSIGKQAFVTPDYFSQEELAAVYNPEHYPEVPDSVAMPGKNVVVLIMESLGKEYMGYYNETGETFTPFLDSIAAKSLSYKYSFANGRISMDAMPSILAGIPMMVEPFFLTPASLNDVKGLPGMASELGYNSAFFHGGHNISLGFSAFAHAIGYDRYVGLDEYCANPKYRGMEDFDGKWAIFDGPFLRFMTDELHEMKQPFVATLFSATTHSPYNVPKELRGEYPEGRQEIHKCWRYTDDCLRATFAQWEKEPWFKNTIFVITGDHTNETCEGRYQTDLGVYEVPLIFYTPDGSLPAEMRDDVAAQQTDVLPTLLHLLGYTKPYVAFGTDLMGDTSGAFAVHYNSGIYQVVKGDWFMQHDGEKITALYRYKTDKNLTTNLVAEDGEDAEVKEMERLLKAMLQQYMSRMNENRLVIAQ